MAVSSDQNGEGEVIRLFKQAQEPVLTAAEISEQLGMTRQGVNYRLKQLEEKGKVSRKKIGSRAVAWWLVED